MASYSFHNRHVLLTGASGGLGSALAYDLADKGAKLVLSSRSQKALDELIANLPEDTKAYAVTADLCLAGEPQRLAEKAIAVLGHIDVLVNNAGIGYFALMEEASEENLRHLFELNTFAPFLLMQHLVPHMKKRHGGRIINIVSCAGRVPIPTVGIYGGSKSALAVMAHTMAFELEPYQIDVVNIYPGTIDTAFEENALREGKRDGLCPRDHCGLPRTDMAVRVMKAAQGPAGEVWLERQGRLLATAALLWPGSVKRRLVALRDKVVQKTAVKKRPWRLLQVESSLACNLKCIMCPWKDASKNLVFQGLMPPEIWAAIKPHLTDVRSIDFTGGGEPLLQPYLAEWIKDAKDAGCEAGFLTNGFLMTQKQARAVYEAGVDWICISMDGADANVYESIRKGSNFERVCNNIAHVAKLRSGKIPKLMINFVLMNINFYQIEAMVELAAELGVDQINFKQCDVIRGEHGKGFGLFGNPEAKETARLEKRLAKARRLARKRNLLTTTFAFKPDEQPVCEQDPRNSMFVRFDGSVAPCINLAIGGPTTFLGEDAEMPQVHYGRLPADDLESLWQAETCQFYRTRFQNRVEAHEKSLVNGLVGGAKGLEKTKEAARKAMPEAPEGCKVCHYLYDI